MELVDLPLKRNKVTRFNLEGSACTRLDRFLVSDGLLELWKIER